MIRIFALLLSLMVLSVPAFAMNIEAEVENQLGIPIDGKKLPTGWKVLEKHGDSMVFQKGDFTMSYAIIPDGSVGNIVDGVFDKGYGSVAERNFRPHVTCTRRTPDGRFVMSVDNGIDQVKIYRFNEKDSKLVQVDAIRCDLESAPRHFRFSSDGRFTYLMYELKNVIDVFTYKTGDRAPVIEKIQTISTTGTVKPNTLVAACAMRLSVDEKYIYCTNAGENTVSIYSRDQETGLLSMICCLPISGEYPKDVAVFPDGKHIASVNHDSGTLTFFSVDYEKGLLVMSGRAVEVNEPNCCAIVKIG